MPNQHRIIVYETRPPFSRPVETEVWANSEHPTQEDIDRAVNNLEGGTGITAMAFIDKERELRLLGKPVLGLGRLGLWQNLHTVSRAGYIARTQD